jgi:hypothetical protein
MAILLFIDPGSFSKGNERRAQVPNGSADSASPVRLLFLLLMLFGGCLPVLAQGAGGPPVISGPTNQTIAVTNPASFSVTVISGYGLRYQWSFNGTKIPGATSSAYSIPAVQPANAGTYSVNVMNNAGSTNSHAMLTVILPPNVLAPPSDQTTIVGRTVTFVVKLNTTTGLPGVTYGDVGCWWSFNNVPTGQSGTTYTIRNVQTNDAGTYTAVVTNMAGMVTKSAKLTVVVRRQLSSPAWLPNGQFQFTLRGTTNVSYSIQASTNLTDWVNVTNWTSGAPFIDTEAGSFSRRYYRATWP